MLDEVKRVIRKEKCKTIICGDFNAKSPTWFSPKENGRGRELVQMANLLNLRLINDRPEATCVRVQGTSIIDLTWCSPDIVNKIYDWKVQKDEITMSDHLYITFKITERLLNTRKANKIAWSFSKFDALISGHTYMGMFYRGCRGKVSRPLSKSAKE